VQRFKFAFLLIGVALLGVIIMETDIREAALLVRQVGAGFVVIVGLYFAAFLIDTFTWQLTVPSAPLNGLWLYRFYQMRIAGEAFNNVIPAGSMGGEPVKAMLLKQHFGIAYREGVASLILSKTINIVSLLVFLCFGFWLMLDADRLAATYKVVAGAGLGAFALGVVLFFLVQRFKIASLTGAWVSRGKLFEKINQVLNVVKDIDDRLVNFYTEQRLRLFSAFLFAFVNWLLGVVEIYYTMMFLGHPISFTDAWIIEAVAQLVRSGTFFIPASLGAQEGAFLIIGTAMTGSPTLGVAVAIVRRIREIIWIIWGFGVYYLLKPNPDTTSFSD